MLVYPNYTRSELVADGVVHVVSIVFCVAAIATLLTSAAYESSGNTIVILTIYGFAMLAMFSCSAAYHMVPFMNWKGLLRRFDQAAIFMKIAGTYTPFALLKIGGFWGYGLFGTVWFFALLGAGMILSMRQNRSNWIVLLYIALGWVGVAVLWPLVASLSAVALFFLFSGGILYSTGTIFHVWESLPFSNVIWHGFVLVATVCHYFAIYFAVLVDV